MFTFRPDAGLAQAIADLARKESKCCAFLDIDVISTDEAIALRVIAPPGASAILDAIQATVAAPEQELAT